MGIIFTIFALFIERKITKYTVFIMKNHCGPYDELVI